MVENFLLVGTNEMQVNNTMSAVDEFCGSRVGVFSLGLGEGLLRKSKEE